MRHQSGGCSVGVAASLGCVAAISRGRAPPASNSDFASRDTGIWVCSTKIGVFGSNGMLY